MMTYLGTLAPANVRPVKRRGPVAGLPVIVYSGKTVVGVAVVADPSFLGPVLDKYLTQANYGDGPFTQVSLAKAVQTVKIAAARTIAAQTDPQLNRMAALATAGLNLAMFN
jgi:hypothetical protein